MMLLDEAIVKNERSRKWKSFNSEFFFRPFYLILEKRAPEAKLKVWLPALYGA
jgi:hypothetical protein